MTILHDFDLISLQGPHSLAPTLNSPTSIGGKLMWNN